MDRKPFVKRNSHASLYSQASGASSSLKDGDDEKAGIKVTLKGRSSRSSSIFSLKRERTASLGSVTTYSYKASKGDYEKKHFRSSVNRLSSRRASTSMEQPKREDPEFTPMPNLLPDFNLEPYITESGFYKTSELVLLADVAVRLRALPKTQRSRITGVKTRNPVTVFLGTNYQYADFNLGHRIPWADTNEIWGPGWHILKFLKSFDTLVYCHRNARIAVITNDQVAWVRRQRYPALTASTQDFPWAAHGLTKRILMKLTAPR